MATGFTNPYKGVGTGTSASGTVKFSYAPHAKATAKPFTAQELLQLQAAQKQSHHGSFFDEVKHAGSDGFHAVGWTFDKLLRPQYAIASGIDNELNAKNSGESRLNVLKAFGTGAEKGFTGKNKEGFGQVLQHHGVLKNHNVLRGAAGLGLDIGSDPLTYVTGGTSVAASSSEHAALLGAAKVALHGESDVEKLSDAAKVLKTGGKDYQFRHALASERIRQLTKPIEKDTLPGAGQDAGKLAVLRESAAAEQKRVEKLLPNIGIGTAKHRLQLTPTKIGGKQVVPALPKLDNAIERGGVLAKPLERFRDKFIRAAGETPETHAATITQRHLAEQYAQENLTILRKHFKDIKLSDGKALKALHYGETVKNFIIKTKSGKYAINEGAISKLMKEGKLDADQVHFLRRWHQATDLLYRRDKALGVDYTNVGEKGQLYVPHLVDKSGDPLSDLQVSRLTKAGFQQARKTRNFSVAQLAAKHAEGKLGRGVETNPFTLLAHTARSRANKQADQTVLDTFASHLGIKTRNVDVAKLGKNHTAQRQLGMEFGVHQAAHDENLADAHTKEQMFLANHELEHSTKIDDIGGKVRSVKFGRNNPLKAARLGKLTKQQMRIMQQHAKEVTDIAKGRHDPLNDMIAPHLEAASQHNDAINAINKQLKGLQSEEKKILKGTQNRAGYSKVQHKTVGGVRDEFNNPLAFDPEIAHAIERTSAVSQGNDDAINAFNAGWRKWLANWKLSVTSVNPGYRIRNTMSDVWAMYVSGMPMHSVVSYGERARRLMQSAKEGNPEALKTITEAYHHGILSGLYQGDVQAIGKMIKYSGSKSSLFHQGKFIKLATKVAQDFNANVENWGRMTHYLYRKQGLGESTVEAAMRVKAAHFDYEDLTPFEQKVMKGVAPFYTWTRKNIPFQIKALASHPGRYAAFPKTMEESEASSPNDKGNIVPSFISQGLGFQIPFGKHNYYLPQIGAADLQLFDSKGGAVQRLTQLANPAISLPFELATNKNLFTGGDISTPNHTRNPVSSLGADLLKFIPGSNVGKTSRTVNGKRVSGPGANPYLAFLLGQVPFGKEVGVNGGGSISRVGKPPAELSYLGGQSVQTVNPQEENMIAQINIANQVKKEVGGLRDAGMYPQVKTKKAKPGSNQAAINRMIRISEGRQ